MLTYEQKQAAEDALNWVLKFVGEGTFWHERHYPALRAALYAVPFDPTPAGTPGAEVPAGNELVSTSDTAPDVATTETPEPPTGKKGKAK